MEKFNAIKWFEDIRKTDIPTVGGKGANLGELTSTGAPVPPGFCVVADTYTRFIEANGLGKEISALLDGLDFEDTAALQERTEKIRTLIKSAPIPAEIEKQIVDAYEALAEKTGLKDPDVAVRSSATAEDLPDADRKSVV